MTAHKPSHLVPKVRFPEFQRAGDWKRDQIGNVASITKGKGVSKADITKGGATPCIRYAELYTHYREVIHEAVSRTNVPHEGLVLSQSEDVIVPASGETRVDIARAACVLPERVALGSDLNILRSDLYGPFFSYLLNSQLRNTIARMAQGDTVAHLYPKQLSQVWLAYPLRFEQQKIADCLGSLDDLIAADGRKLEALRQYKQGLMQQLFPQPGETVPRLRFPEFQNAPEWSLESIDEFAQTTTGNRDTQDKVDGGSYPFFVRSQSTERIDTYAYNGEAVLTSGDGVGVGKNFHYIDGKFDFHQRVYCIHQFKSRVLGRFFFFYFSEHFGPRVRRVSAKNSVDSVRRSMITDMPVPLPDLVEQKTIANCLSALDTLIDAQVAKLDTLRTHKQGLLQQLFPSLDGQ